MFHKNIIDESEKKAIKILEDWDDILNKKSSAALIFEMFYVNLVKNLIHDDLGDDLYEEFSKNSIYPPVTIIVIRPESMLKISIIRICSSWMKYKKMQNII